MSLTLDQRIQKDLENLYNNGSLDGAIAFAKRLNNESVIKEKLSSKGMPGYFVGKRKKAKTVFIMLNPGYNADGTSNKKGQLVLGADNHCALILLL